MKKQDIISTALSLGIEVREMDFGIFDPIPAYSVQVKSEHRNNLYLVTDNRTRTSLIQGIRVIAERAKITLPAGFTA